MKTTTIYQSPNVQEEAEKLSDEMPVFKVGDWVVMTEDGFWASSEYVFKSKRDAIEEVSLTTMDPRKTPKVYRRGIGDYEYCPKDVDYGSYGASYIIRRITKENVEQYNQEMKEQWEDDPLSAYDE